MKRSRPTRKYLGTIVTHSNYREILSTEGADKVEFHKKHLKAYIRGDQMFTHGFTVPKDEFESPKPIFHFVEQETE